MKLYYSSRIFMGACCISCETLYLSVSHPFCMQVAYIKIFWELMNLLASIIIKTLINNLYIPLIYTKIMSIEPLVSKIFNILL